jgi:tRNA1Val (adenine37-N6)-methyltransferase
MKERLFKFKQFEVSHLRSAMKIGVDGVMVGAWGGKQITDTLAHINILDVGTGCGLIALMCAQLLPNAVITAIDIDIPSIEEATSNFNTSRWSNRLKALPYSFEKFATIYPSYKADIIISNPPFFNSGISDPSSAREIARHGAELNPQTVITTGKKLLADNGKIIMIMPPEWLNNTDKCALPLIRQNTCFIKGRIDRPIKRVLCCYTKASDTDNLCETNLEIETSPGIFTKEYIDLCSPFYLKF